MRSYLIHRLKDSASEHFRWAPHVCGRTPVKPKDYEAGAGLEAASEYVAWRMLRDAGTPLRVGDLLEEGGGQLLICKYVGFDPAEWQLPVAKPHEGQTAGTGVAAGTETPTVAAEAV